MTVFPARYNIAAIVPKYEQTALQALALPGGNPTACVPTVSRSVMMAACSTGIQSMIL